MRRQGARRVRRSWAGFRSASGWLLILLIALAFVAWRQSYGIERERALRALETERSVAEAERIAALRRLEELRSRSRIVRVARDRLGMHLPEDREIIFLRVAQP